MDNRLLVINENPKILEEILRAYHNEEFQVDIARSGAEGYRKLQEEKYNVVMIGMTLRDINGEKLLNYIKKEKPDIICIVYTSIISPSQILFLVNKMHVFRIFLEPGDYRGAMLEAINEAFENYDLKVMMQEINQNALAEIEEHQNDYNEIRESTVEQEEAELVVRRMAKAIFTTFLQSYSDLSLQERDELERLQEQMVEQYLMENKIPAGDLMSMEVKLRHHFCEGLPGRSLGVRLESNVIRLSDDFIQNVYMVLYLLTLNISRRIHEYDAHINVGFETSSRMIVSMDFQLYQEKQEEPDSALERAVTELYEQSVEVLCDSIAKKESSGVISYQICFDTNKSRIFDA